MIKLKKMALPAAIAMACSMQAFAESVDGSGLALDEIVVTAQKKEDLAQKIPVAVTKLSQSTIENNNIQNVDDLDQRIPSLVTQDSVVSGYGTISVRGQRTARIDSTSSSPVGVYFDMVPLETMTSVMVDMIDIESVEVLRGPQGTLYGKNTPAGAINFTSRKPDDEFGGTVEYGTGNYGLQRSGVSIDTGRHGGLAARVKVMNKKLDGFVENTNDTTEHDYGYLDQDAMKLTLHYNGVEGLDVRYMYDKSEDETVKMYTTPVYVEPDVSQTLQFFGYPAFMADAAAADAASRITDGWVDEGTSPFPLPKEGGKHEGHSLVVEYDATDLIRLRSVTGYRENERNVAFDGIFPGEAFGMQLLPGVATLEDRSYGNETFSQEFNLIGVNEDLTLDYVLGVFYTEDEAEDKGVTAFVPSTGFDISDRVGTANFKSKSVFGQMTWKPDAFDSRLSLTAGLRHNKDESETQLNYSMSGIAPVPVPFEINDEDEWSATTGTFAVGYEFTDDMMAYAKYSTGYRAGGFFMDMTQTTSYEPEKVNTVELGLKTSLFDGRGLLNLALHHSDMQDQQKVITDPVTFEPQVHNIGQLDTWGLEADFMYKLAAMTELGLSYAYLDYDVVEVKDALGNYGPVGEDVTELFELSQSPKHVATVWLAHTFGLYDWGTPFADVNYRWQDDSYSASAVHAPSFEGYDFVRPSHGIFNATLGIKDIPISKDMSGEIVLWGRNLTDEYTVQYHLPLTPWGNMASQGTPRTYGIDFKVHF